MTSSYQMWLTRNRELEKMRFPVLPEKFTVKIGSRNTTVDIAGLGEIIVKQGRAATSITFSSFFPASDFTGSEGGVREPLEYYETILKWKDSSKPVHFIIAGSFVNMFCWIDSFVVGEIGGDTGTIHYTITLTEFREVHVRQVKIEDSTAIVSDSTDRADNQVQPSTYTVVKGDCLWNIAKKFLGDGSRWKEILELNGDVIKAGNLILPGMVLKLPAS